MTYAVKFLSYYFDYCLSSHCDVIVQIARVARHVLYHPYEWREVNGLLFGHSLGLHHHQVAHWGVERVDLEELTFPDEALTLLADGGAIRVGLLQHLLIQVVVYLSLGLDNLGVAYTLLRSVHIHHLTSAPLASAQTYLASWLCHQICLGNLTLGALGYLADYLYAEYALLLYRLRQSYHLRYLCEHALNLVVEIVVIVDHAQVGMTGPRVAQLLAVPIMSCLRELPLFLHA